MPGDISHDATAELLKPAPKAFLIEYDVSTVANKAKTDSPQCIEAVA
jgi:putative SOS response-associated peptidase YedK